MREFELIGRLRERLAIGRDDTILGIGDDAAVIAPGAGQQLAVTTDTLIAGRHFPQDTAAFDIGFKAVAVNLSDLAAMGAQPAWLTVALSAPSLESGWCEAFLDGVQAAIGSACIDIIGGDTTRGPLTVTITALGTVAAGRTLRRDGARAGDIVAVTGTLGDAACGLALWPARAGRSDDAARHLIARLCRPAWRNGAALIGKAHAVIDVSDGLAADLGHILAASGVGAVIDVESLPASHALVGCAPNVDARRALQLTGGDDYELCVCLPAQTLAAARRALGCRLTPIGKIEADPGLRLVDSSGRARQELLERRHGWDHFGPDRSS